MKEVWEQLEKTDQEILEQEAMMEDKEDPMELPQPTLAPPLFPQPNLYEQLMQDFTENPVVRVESQGSSLSA
jgi:hypothetical protein